jgi:HEXXH motif-containing protein
MIKKIIPMGISISKHNSASYSSCIGHLYMSYPVDMEHPELAILEASIHELNHNKLNLIMKHDPLILNTREEAYYSPYRPDARHIHGIYLGLHAMVAVFHVFFSAYRDGIIMLNDNWMEKSLSYVIKNGLSIRVLKKYGSYTPLGQDILNGMIMIQKDTCSIIHSLGIATDIKQRSESMVRKHFSEVTKKYPYLRY